jgi:hypothetical protein
MSSWDVVQAQGLRLFVCSFFSSLLGQHFTITPVVKNGAFKKRLATIASAAKPQANKCPLKPNTSKQAPARTSKAQLNKQARTSKAQLRPHPRSSILVPPLDLHPPPPVFARVRQRSCRQLLPVSEELLRNGAGGWERARTVCGEEQKGRRWPGPYVPAPAGRAAPKYLSMYSTRD